MNSVQPKGLTARKLFAQSNTRVINEIVKDQVVIIDAAIMTAHHAGFNKIDHELPSNFVINNVDKIDAQTIVYSEILMIYKKPEPEGKGFEHVYITVGPRSILHIQWHNGMDDHERNIRKSYIQQCLKPR